MTLIGQRLGQYEILSLLGEGGMAAVYRARQLNIDREVAIKVIKPGLIGQDQMTDFVRRFEREARTIATLDHPHILKLFDYGQHEGMLYLVMPLLVGGSLGDLILKGPLPTAQAARLLEQVAGALDYAHEQGIIHRDLKPANILLDGRGNAILTDFGIAKVTQNTALTQTGLVMGTPSYMSPEQWQGRDLDARSDVYALGVILHEMLAGELPFKADTPLSLMYMHLHDAPPSVRASRPDLPPSAELALKTALAKEREQRFQSAGELAAAFSAALTAPAPAAPRRGAKTVKVTPEPEASEAPRPSGRRNGLLALGAVGVIAVIGLLAVMLGRGAGQTSTATLTLPPATTRAGIALLPTRTSTPAPATGTATPGPTVDVQGTNRAVQTAVAATVTSVAEKTRIAQAARALPTVQALPTLTPTDEPNLETLAAATFAGRATLTANAAASFTKTPAPTASSTPDRPKTLAVMVAMTDTAVAVASFTKTRTPTTTPTRTSVQTATRTSTKPPATVIAAVPPPQETAIARPSSLRACVSSGVLQVGSDATYPPFESINEKTNRIEGFDVELLEAIGMRAGFTVNFHNTLFETIFTALSYGQYDLVISAATITDERSKVVSFSNPYFEGGPVIMVRQADASNVKGPADLAGKTIGVQLGTTGAEAAKKIKDVKAVKEYPTATEAHQALSKGAVDAVIDDRTVALFVVANRPELKLAVVGEVLAPEYYGIAIRKDCTDLLDKVNKALGEVIFDGTYARLYEKYFGAQPPAAMRTGGKGFSAAPAAMSVPSVTKNADWKPVERDFDGVAMVQVPAGCFMMGSNDGESDEKPVTRICFDTAFWIDKTEVTQGQFKRLGGVAANQPAFTGDNRPVEDITWFEARDFCAKRGARLPTEAEWEYAARGPDSLIYPWGNSFDHNKVVHQRSSSQGTAEVGSNPAGVSWVGALDLSGNVLEWVSSLYRPYPYAASDGRESNSDTSSARGVRGGSWYSSDPVDLRAADRIRGDPVVRGGSLGFRCARSS